MTRVPFQSCRQTILGLLLLILICADTIVGRRIHTDQQASKSQSKINRGSGRLESRLLGSVRTSYPGATAVLDSWPPTDYRVTYIDDLVERNLGAAFSDYRVENYSRFITVPKQSVLYAVGDGMKLVKLDLTSLMLLDMYSLPQKTGENSLCPDHTSCQQSTDISLLAQMPNEEMVWFCYAHYLHRQHRLISFAQSGCMVPSISSLTEPLLQWENPEFTAFDPRQLASVFNAGDGYTYIAGGAHNHVQILRTRMPDWNGKLNWSGVLNLDNSRSLITEPSEILLTFETEDSVFFVVREQSLQSKRLHRARSDLHTKPDLTYVDASCLVRICKNDPGGLAHFSADKFATFAKAQLKCQAADDSGLRFPFVYLTSAYWDTESQRLFAAFTTERLAPVGSALCMYSKESIEAAFAGPLVSQTLNSVSPKSKQSISTPNGFPDICKRFNSKNITAEELSVGRRLSLSFPNRYKSIESTNHRALLTQSGQVWRQIAVYSPSSRSSPVKPDQLVHTTMVLLASESVIVRLAMYETPAQDSSNKASGFVEPTICKLNEIRLGSNWQVLQRLPIASGNQRSPKTRINPMNIMGYVWDVEDGQNEEDVEAIHQVEITQHRLVILTNRQIIQLPLTDCSVYTTYEDCIQSKDPHCGWSWPDGQCRDGYATEKQADGNTTSWYTTFSPSVDRTISFFQTDSVCPSDLHRLNTREREWSDWYTCRWYSSLTSGSGTRMQPLEDELSARKDRQRQPLGRCRCRMCLSGTRCKLGSQEVINCTSSNLNWLPWSVWSRCDPETGVQTRHRSCRRHAICVGSSREQRSCSSPTMWSESFEHLSPAQGPSNPKRLKHRNTALHLQEDTFTLNHILLVALFCLLIGSLVTTFVLFAYWQYCSEPSLSNLFHYPGNPTRSSKHRSKARDNSLTCHVTTDPEPWPHSPNTDDTPWMSDLASTSSRYPLTVSNNPEMMNCKPTVGRPKVKQLCTDCSKSLSISGPPTSSTLLKASFTFDSLDTEGNVSPTTSLCPASHNQSVRTPRPSSLSSGTIRRASMNALDGR